MNINLKEVVNNYKNYNYFYKGLKGLALHKGDFTTLPSPLKVAIAILLLIIIIVAYNIY
ncbi:hypothetical protein C8034_v008692 [Colletotrichum sidae]|uniref:Uncharacterized protein n=1 Tax=Colletotrichum sidae TaxID=1347389 RepID=A0A4R8Q0N1_9PEZI|nr:hypothetical protein C8034_v008692 [Colletotrichum sidae]